MKQIWKDVGISVVMGIILPAALLAAVVALSGTKEGSTQETLPMVEHDLEMAATQLPIWTQSPETTQPPPRQIDVLMQDGQVESMVLNDYLTSVILAEMPVSFETEALKAQSVVARTYAIRAAEGAAKHANAAVCTNASCCQGYMEVETFLSKGGKEKDVQRIRELVSSTDTQVLTYEGKLIEATYFSCSGGTTEDAVAVWGTEVPYLQSVVSPGEEHATHYSDAVTFSSGEFVERLGMELAGDPLNWFGETVRTDGGGVDTMEIGKQKFSGTQLRQLLGLRSTAFTVHVEGDRITITTRGYGHRVGMSQYGADAMAATGSTYEQILTYYYQGTELAAR